MGSSFADIEKDVLDCWRLMADFLETDLPPPKIKAYRPRIVPSNETSCLDSNGKIWIVSADFGNPAVYFEEIAHSLREVLSVDFLRHYPRFIKDTYLQCTFDRQVDEFFGRIGQSMGVELLKKSSLPIAYGKPVPQYSDLDYLREQVAYLNSAVPGDQGSWIYKNQKDNYTRTFLLNIFGYIVAEQFISGCANFMQEGKALFRQSNRSVRRRFFENASLQPYKELLKDPNRPS